MKQSVVFGGFAQVIQRGFQFLPGQMFHARYYNMKRIRVNLRPSAATIHNS